MIHYFNFFFNGYPRKLPFKNLNTFGINAEARYFIALSSIDEIQEIIAEKIFKNNQKLILGGGSSLLFCKNLDGIILKITSTKSVSLV